MEQTFEFKEWLEEQIYSDEKIINTLKEISERYGYETQKVFRFSCNKKRLPYQEDYSRVTLERFEAKVSTSSSIWNVEQSVVFAKQLNESIQFASELNTVLNNAIHVYTNKYKKMKKQENIKKDIDNNL